MQDLLPTLLPRLEQHRLPGLNAGPEAFYPFYAGLSLASLPASICCWLGAPPFGAPPLVPEILDRFPEGVQRVLLLVIDGLGLDHLQACLDLAHTDRDYVVWGELAAGGVLAPLTSVVPSTTSTALTTFWTGAFPAAHGVVGYEVWLKEYSMIANMILHSPASYLGDVGSLSKAGFQPQAFLPVPTLCPHLAAHGIRPYALQHASIARSGISTMLMPGVDILPFRSQSDLFVTLDGLLDERVGERSYIYVYWGDLDEHAHRFGPADPRVGLEFAGFSRKLEYFLHRRRARGPSGDLLLITADHGHIPTPQQPAYELRNHPGLLDCLTMLPSGEARLPFVFLKNGREAAFLRYLEETWPGQFLALPSADAVQAGLFGPCEPYSRLADRLGDFVIVPQSRAYWWFADRDNMLLGRHGGLSRNEMLVPLLGVLL